MIIETITVNRVTREMTDLMKSYNIQILEVEPYAEIDDESLYCSVSYRANRIFEANEFKELVKLLDEVISPAVIVWDEVEADYHDLFTIGKQYSVISFHGPDSRMAKILNDSNEQMIISCNSSVYGENRVIFKE